MYTKTCFLYKRHKLLKPLKTFNTNVFKRLKKALSHGWINACMGLKKTFYLIKFVNEISSRRQHVTYYIDLTKEDVTVHWFTRFWFQFCASILLQSFLLYCLSNLDFCAHWNMVEQWCTKQANQKRSALQKRQNCLPKSLLHMFKKKKGNLRKQKHSGHLKPKRLLKNRTEHWQLQSQKGNESSDR